MGLLYLYSRNTLCQNFLLTARSDKQICIVLIIVIIILSGPGSSVGIATELRA